MTHPADMERAEELRARLDYAVQNMTAAKDKVLEAHADYELRRKEHIKALRDYLDFKPVVEGA